MDERKKWITTETAARIKYYRHLKGLSQEEVALKAELNPAYFGQVERGLKCPTIDTLYKIALTMEISLADLFRSGSASASSEEQAKRMEDLLARVPENKVDQVFKILEDVISLF